MSAQLKRPIFNGLIRFAAESWTASVDITIVVPGDFW